MSKYKIKGEWEKMGEKFNNEKFIFKNGVLVLFYLFEKKNINGEWEKWRK